MAQTIEYAAKTPFHEQRSAGMIPAHIRAEVDRQNTEDRSADDELTERAAEVCKRAGLPTP